MRKDPKEYRRCSRTTIRQIVKELHISKEEAIRGIRELLKCNLIHQCYDRAGNVIPDLYEIPESSD